MKKVLKITAIVAAALFLTVYGVGCWYFYTHYFYGTKIDGVIYGCMTPEEVAAEVRRNLDVFTAGGGYIFSQVHNLEASVSGENLLAAFLTAKAYRG